MKEDIAIRWAEALESGRWRQGRGSFCYPPWHGDADQRPMFCCLGVLSSLVDGEETREESTLLPETRESAGINHDGELRVGSKSLIELNDDKWFTFPEIAALIRKHWREI